MIQSGSDFFYCVTNTSSWAGGSKCFNYTQIKNSPIMEVLHDQVAPLPIKENHHDPSKGSFALSL